jgi:hypothetical protein
MFKEKHEDVIIKMQFVGCVNNDKEVDAKNLEVMRFFFVTLVLCMLLIQRQ